MAFFDGVDDYLTNNAPGLLATGYPLTVGLRFKPSSFPGFTPWSYSDTATLNARFNISISTGGLVQIIAKDSGTQVVAATTGAVTANTEPFVLARFISAANRRGSVLFGTGAIEHVQNTTSRSPLTMTAITLGALRNTSAAGFLPGFLTEIWWADVDIQPGGGQLDDAILRQLANFGPFSLPHIRPNIVEYRSLRSSLAGQVFDEDYARSQPQTWLNVGGVTVGTHSILPAGYENPVPRSSLVMI